MEMGMTYELIRRRGMKNIRMRIREDGTILVSAPYGVSRAAIEDVLRRHMQELCRGRENQDAARRRWADFVENSLQSRNVPKEKIQKSGDDVIVGTPFARGSLFNGLPLVTDRTGFRKLFEEAYANFSRAHRIMVSHVTMRMMKSRWGSCRPGNGRITFNLLLLYVPRECARYVIYHELCHYLELNHSDRFWQQVKQYVPAYREREKTLRLYGEILISHRMSERAGDKPLQ